MGLISVCVLLLCWSSLTHAAPPQITQDTYYVCEDVPQGGLAFDILATDADNDPLTYSISGPAAHLFRVKPSNGSVYLVEDLDRDAEGSQSLLDLTVTVSDTTNRPVSADVFVYILDANDNAPIFDNASYEKAVPENTSVDTTLFKVKATDADSGTAGAVTYSINGSVPSSGENAFRIDTQGNFILNEKLNYNDLSPSYRIRILASDNGGKCHYTEVNYMSRSVIAYITVEDIPDLDPEFTARSYIESVEENTAIGTPVITVSAIDPDAGINDDIIYSIYNSSVDGLFRINQEGVISVNSEIDREAIGDTVMLTVMAKETNLNIHEVQASAATQVRINIIDMNDNKPKFYRCVESECVPASRFTGEAEEHSLKAVSINMTVKDADKNAETILSLEGAGKDIFSVQPPEAFSNTVVQLTVIDSEALDYERIKEITLQVIAVDKGDPALSSTADVTITVLDANDHSPLFANDTYYAKVPEHCPDGTVVATITAEDPDTMDQGAITYSLLPTSILQYFDVESKTGKVFVKNGALLDRESRALFSVTLQARDSDQQPGSTVLEITVTDINDKAPVPNRKTYQVYVTEGQNLEDVQIEATDGDEPDTPNSQLVYTIEPGLYSDNFTINPETGVLSNNGPLDREDIDPDLDGKIKLIVKISDQGDPPQSAMVEVFINVEDVNDNSPEFEKNLYSFTVKEGEKGAFVGSVYAEDHDQTHDFNRISFNIASGGFGSFMISSVKNASGYTGRISVDQDIELDYDSELKIFSLKIAATDIGQGKAEATVEVHVLDVNDERPEFKPIAPVNVIENSKDEAPIGKFDAVDKDTTASLVYELVSVTCKCGEDKVDKPCDWFVLEPNGEVKVNNSATIDYESCQQAIVEAQVVDKNTEKGEPNSASPGEMIINIQDDNDNTPEFISSNSVFVVVSETANPDTSVANVKAIDRDSGDNAKIEFKVSKVQYVDSDGQSSDPGTLFEATTSLKDSIYLGDIKATQKLDTKLKGKYVVTVEARDTGGRTNTTEIEIVVVGETYKNELKFGYPKPYIEARKEEIRSDLMACTQALAQVVAIKEDTSEPARESGITIMEAYFYYANGTAVEPNTVNKELSSPENYAIMSKYKLIYVGVVEQVEPESNTEVFILIGIVAGFIIVTAVLTMSLFCTRRNYRRKLKASNAMKSASTVMSDQRGGPVVPGTNLYTMEGANPVLNLNIDTAIALDLGEDSDVDKVSLNSLDNSDDVAVNEKDNKPILPKTYDDDKDNESGPPAYIEPLGAALAQRDQKIRSNNPLLGDTNPIFDTTDL